MSTMMIKKMAEERIRAAMLSLSTKKLLKVVYIGISKKMNRIGRKNILIIDSKLYVFDYGKSRAFNLHTS